MKNPYPYRRHRYACGLRLRPNNHPGTGKGSQNRPGERDDRAPGHSDHPQ